VAETAPEAAVGGGARRTLGTWDGVSVVIGIVVGVSLFKVPALVFGAVAGPWLGLGIWVLGGALSLIGALCYAELASAYPRSGGDYVYLSRAYGPWVGFLFGWAQLVAVLTGSIGAMAYVFADYAVELWGGSAAPLAAAAVVALTALNLLGVAWGAPAQNALTLAKVVGLGGVLAAGLLAAGEPRAPAAAASGGSGGFGFAMVLVLYAYGGTTRRTWRRRSTIPAATCPACCCSAREPWPCCICSSTPLTCAAWAWPVCAPPRPRRPRCSTPRSAPGLRAR